MGGIESLVTNYNCSLRSNSSKYSRPHLGCFHFGKNENMPAVVQLPREVRRYFTHISSEKTKNTPMGVNVFACGRLCTKLKPL
jgi:hypothetical protein